MTRTQGVLSGNGVVRGGIIFKACISIILHRTIFKDIVFALQGWLNNLVIFVVFPSVIPATFGFLLSQE